jgi:dTDP-4-amino-4,6-dideoxygalactose transaminase
VPSATLGFSMLARAALSSSSVESSEAALVSLLSGRQAVLFASARGALTAAVRATVADRGVVQLPAYTCVAVPNAVCSAGCQPGWVDVDALGRPRFTADGAAALMTQDTFGFPCTAPPTDLPVIRDASHRADLIFEPAGAARVIVTSFEHSKALSAGLGGLAVTDDPGLADDLRSVRDEAPTRGSSARHAAVTLAGLLSGRALFRGRRALGIALDRVASALDADWMRGQNDLEIAGYGVSPALLGRPTSVAAALMVAQLDAYTQVAAERSRIVATYDTALGVSRLPLPLVRYPVEVSDRDRTSALFRDAGWDLGRPWFEGLVHPSQANPVDFGLRPESFPMASRLAASVVNLPTHPLVSARDAHELARLAAASGARPLVTE